MKLLQVPDIPNYQVDVVNGVVYTMRYGRLREVKMRTKYKSFYYQSQRKDYRYYALQNDVLRNQSP